MAGGDLKRKLTAIFSADVEGYSRLMGDNELATIETLTLYKETMGKLIRQYRGRVVDSTGDNLLAEFGSVVDAVQCAVEVQQVLSSKNEPLPENRRMKFRIGINLGDVVEEGERIYGDGVNVAARVESLAKGGGISLSGTAYDQLGKKLPLGYEYLGEQTVKNIEKPVRVYRVLTEAEAAGKVIGEERPRQKQLRGIAIGGVAILIIVAAALAIWNYYFRPAFEPASVKKMAQQLPERPSIAVLPFENMSGDPEQEYFSDGITEEIITALSKVPRLFVIARNSSFTYKGKPVKVQQVSEDLGVQYVLEGSVRKSEKRVRVTAQLVDALNGRHLWAETYDRELGDIFALQDQITFKVVEALQVKLTEGEQATIVAGGTHNFEAYTKFLKGLEYVKRFNQEGNLLGRKVAEEVIALDPNYPRGYRMLATTHWLDMRLGISKSPKESLTKAAELYQKVIVMDPTDAIAHCFLGLVYTLMRQHERGMAVAEKAVALNPNAADAQCILGVILHYNGKQKGAIEAIKKAIRLNPFPPNWYWLDLGFAYCHAGMYEEAISVYNKVLALSPDNFFAHLRLAAAYSLAGREDEARAEAEEVLRLNPRYCVENFRNTVPYKNPADMELIIKALLKAGLPETPPLPLPDKPSIAVLPFENMSGDPDQEYFSDGLTEDIITALSKTPKLFVIARHSSFKYKGKPVWIPTVGKELGVKYVLEGSVRKAGDNVRVTVQLVEAQTNSHIWAERYDRTLKDIFAVQDVITKNIVTSVHVQLTEGEQARLYAKSTANLDAYLKALEAKWYLRQTTKQGLLRAKQLAEEAIALDPDYPSAYNTLGMFYGISPWIGLSKSPAESIKRAIELCQKAISLDDSLAAAHVALGYFLTMARQYDKAIAEGERGLALAPSSADVIQNYAAILSYAGRREEAIPLFREALRLNPIPPNSYYRHFGMTLREAGHYEEAIAMHKKAVENEPNDLLAHVGLTAHYAYAGRMDEARAEAKEVLRIKPNFSVDQFGKVMPNKDPAVTARLVEALREAGLK